MSNHSVHVNVSDEYRFRRFVKCEVRCGVAILKLTRHSIGLTNLELNPLRSYVYDRLKIEICL